MRDIAPAWGAEVVSSDIVGYNKVKLSSRLTMTGAQFQEVGSATGEIDINSIRPDAFTTGVDWDSDDYDFGASMLVWDGRGYSDEFFWTGEVPAEIQAAFKEDLELDEDFVYNNIWVDGDLVPVDVVFPAGQAFWIQDAARTASSKTDLTISGEVPNVSVQKTFKATTRLTMLSNPYPVGFNLNELVLTDVAGVDWESDDYDFGASILIWDGRGYSQEYYWTGVVPAEIQQAFKEDLELDESVVYNNIWVDGDLVPVDVTIPIGGAFWLQNTAATANSAVTFPDL